VYFGEIPPAVVRQRLGLGDGYTVDGVLGFGVFDRAADPVLADLTAHVDRSGVEVVLTPVTAAMFSHAVDLVATTPTGPRRLWLVPVMGSAMMAYYLHMGCLLGARALVLGGSAGGLAEGMAVGDLVVPPVITGNDSTALYSRHSEAGTRTGPHGPRIEPDGALASDLAVRLRALHPAAPLWRSETVTCEMFGAETGDDVARWSAAGFGAVEMEAAVVCAVGAAFRVPAAAAIYVADCLISGETVYQTTYGDSRAVRHASRLYVIGAAFDTLLGAVG
jgi:purine-nucleoside phosphorylase